MEVLLTEQTKNLSAIHSEGNADAMPPPPSHEETKSEAKNEAPTVHPDGQTSKSEDEAAGEQVETNTPAAYRRRNPGKFVESPHWLSKGWHTEVKVRQRGLSAGKEDKYYYDPDSRLRFRSKKEVLRFLATEESSKRRPEGELRDETKHLPVTTSEFYSSASDIGGISPYSPTRDSLLSYPSCGMPSSTTHSSDLLVHDNHTASLPSYTSPMATVIHQSGAVNKVSIPTGTLISDLHDKAALQNTVNPYTIRTQLTDNSDFHFHNNHAAPLHSHPLPMAAVIHQLAAVSNVSRPTVTPASGFYDSVASQSTVNSNTLRIQSIGSNFPFHNKHAARLIPYRSPMFGFTPQLGAVNNVTVPTATQISLSAFNPDATWRPTKFQRVLNDQQGSRVPILTEERVPIFTEEKPNESYMKEGKRMFDPNWQ